MSSRKTSRTSARTGGLSVARNGHERERSVESLRREAATRRASLRRTAAALEDRLRVRGHQMSEVVEKPRETVEHAREKLEGVDSFVHRHRYAILGGALGVGVVLGLRRKRRPVRAGNMEDAVRFVMERQRPS